MPSCQPTRTGSDCRIKLRFIPAYCPHLDPIERLWGLMHRHITHNRCYERFADFRDAILTFLRGRPTRMIVALDVFISRATALIDAPSDSRCCAFCRCSPSSTGLRPNVFPSALARVWPDSVRSTPIVILPAGLVRSTPPSARQ